MAGLLRQVTDQYRVATRYHSVGDGVTCGLRDEQSELGDRSCPEGSAYPAWAVWRRERSCAVSPFRAQKRGSPAPWWTNLIDDGSAAILQGYRTVSLTLRCRWARCWTTWHVPLV